MCTYKDTGCIIESMLKNRYSWGLQELKIAYRRLWSLQMRHFSKWTKFLFCTFPPPLSLPNVAGILGLKCISFLKLKYMFSINDIFMTSKHIFELETNWQCPFSPQLNVPHLCLCLCWEKRKCYFSRGRFWNSLSAVINQLPRWRHSSHHQPSLAPWPLRFLPYICFSIHGNRSIFTVQGQK